MRVPVPREGLRTAEIATGENLEILFFVHGPAAKDPTAPRAVNDLEVNFEVQTPDGKAAKNWPPQSFESFFIDQPLPLKLTTTDASPVRAVLRELP